MSVTVVSSQKVKANNGRTQDQIGQVMTTFPTVSEEIGRILSALPSTSILLKSDLTVLRASGRAIALGLVNRDSLRVIEIAEMAKQVLRDGQTRDAEIRVRRPPLGREWMELRIRVADLGSDVLLVLIDDLAEERRVDAVRRDFVANVSHELKTPVGALSLLAEAIMASSEDPAQVEHFAGRMQIEAKRLTDLVQDVIDLSRLQGADTLAEAEPIQIDRVARSAVDELRTQASAAGIEIECQEEPSAVVFGDFGQLSTALRNLLANAISYSPPNTRVAVVISKSNGLIEVSVKDQGRGIAAGDLERVFERFYRVDADRSRGTGGTGLGLAIVKHVAQNHGGECTVWSEVGVGSTFTLRLPAFQPGRDNQDWTQ